MLNPLVQIFLNFDGRCEEALEFYRTALDAKIDIMMRAKENPEAGECAPADEEKIMYSNFRIGETVIMASDCQGTGTAAFKGFSLSLSVGDEAEAARLFAVLADGGQVDMPLAKTFWSPCFGVVSDRFGLSWMVSVAH